MFLQMCVYPGGGGGVVSQHAFAGGIPTCLAAGLPEGGCLHLGVACSGVGCGGDPPGLQTATVADGTHPTGMHSRFVNKYLHIYQFIFGVINIHCNI